MNKKGITLTMLAIIVVMMSILAVSAGSLSIGLIKKANEQNVISDMLLIQTQVKIIMENVAFNGDTSKYIGIKLKNVPNKKEVAGSSLTEDELEKDTIYVYDKQTLNSLGLSKIDSGNIFLVDYSNSDVIYPGGCQREDGTVLYRLSQANQNLISYENSSNLVVTFESGTDYIKATVYLSGTATDYKFIIANTEEEAKNKAGTWVKSSSNSFTNLSPNTNYYIVVKIKTPSGEEQTSKVFRVKTQ